MIIDISTRQGEKGYAARFSAEPRPSFVKRRRWLPLYIILALVGAGVVVEVVSSRSLGSALEQARAAGLATTADEMRANSPNLADNAVTDFASAISHYKALPKEERTVVSSYEFYARHADIDKSYANLGVAGHVDDDRVDSCLPVWRPVFEALGRAVEKPHLDWNRNWELGYNLLLPEYADLKGIAKAMAVDAESAVRHGDRARALLRLRQLRIMARQIEEEPILIAFLVGAAIRAIADKKAMDLAFIYQSDAQLVADLRTFLMDESLPDIRPAMRGETFANLIILDQVAQNPAPIIGGYDGVDRWNNPDSIKLRLLKISSFRNKVKSTLVARFTKARQAFGDGPSQWEKTESALANLDGAIGADQSMVGQMVGVVTPIFSPAGAVVGKIAARRNIGVMLTYLIDERRTTGRWPSKLPTRGEWNIDLVSRKPLLYRATKARFVLYSVSANRKDDGGDLEKGGSRDLAVGPFEGRLVVRG